MKKKDLLLGRKYFVRPSSQASGVMELERCEPGYAVMFVEDKRYDPMTKETETVRHYKNIMYLWILEEATDG